ncbi:Acid protease [Mycena venus]|uniref:Acid protease n=1 Tax=Mycena venus TaxID=2733690 RepID=A0A8H6XMS5_9AGAR|nr:Acid protease [Mycena venus]
MLKMTFLSALSIIYLLGVANARFTVVRRRDPAPGVQMQAKLLPPAEFSVPFTGKTPRRKAKNDAFAAVRRWSPATCTDTAIVDAANFNFKNDYLTDVTIGGQNFSLLIDTGSSDTYVVQKGFNCSDAQGDPLPQASCQFGTAGFDTEASKTFKPFPNVIYHNIFGDGNTLTGPVGFDTVTIGGLAVTQEIAVPTLAVHTGDNISSGILGLAFPRLTNVFNTTDIANISDANRLVYDPFFLSAVKEKRVKNPFFSVALDRGTFEQEASNTFIPNSGFLSFGGIAPVPVLDTCVTVPIQGYDANSAPSNSPNAEFRFYTVDIDSYAFPGSTGLITANNNTILDTGTAFNIVPQDVAAAYAAAFNPPGVLTLVPNSTLSGFAVDCNAEAPEFLVTIGGKTFSIDPRDQIVPFGNNGTIICATGTQGPSILTNAPNSLFILGDVFLHNVVATFNPIAGEITLTQRAKY